MSNELFTNGTLSGVFTKFAIPSIFTSLLMISTFLVDGVLIGRFLGSQGLASFNLVFPVFSFLVAFGVVIATGGSALIGKFLGENKVKEAKQIFNLAIILTVISSIILSVVTIIFSDGITSLLGATELLYESTKDYFSTLALFFVLFLVGLILQYFIRNEGDSMYPIKTTMVSVAINIPLTYLFLGVFNMGLGAAALATGLSIIPSTGLLIFYFLRKKAILSYGKPIFDFTVIKKILYNGSSEGLSEFSVGIVVLVFNLTLIQFLGEIGIAAFAIISLTSLIVLMINFGLSMALQPMVSYYFGAKSSKKVKDTLKMAVKFSIIVGIVSYILVFLFGEHFIGLFTDGNQQLTSLAYDAIRVYGISYFFIGVNLLSSSYLTALQKPKLSLLVSMSYNFLFVIIGLLSFPHIFGAPGIWLAVPIANIMAIFVSIYFVKRQNKELTNTR